VKSKRRAAWSEEARVAIAAQLLTANGKRSSRVMAFTDVEACVEAALESELGFSWRSAGESGDVRAVTTLCLAVVRDDHVTISVASAHGAATPSSAWGDIATWDRFEPTSNRATLLAWAGRKRPDRVRLAVKVDAPERATKESLLARIVENPADDAPRLVYADLLAEEGDPRGEFIQVQCAGLEARASELLEEHGAKWLGPEVTSTLQVRFERGFVHEARVLDLRALAACTPFFESEPVVSLVVDVRGVFEGATLSAFDWTQRLHALALERAGWSRFTPAGSEQIGRLLEGRRWKWLERLRFRGMSVGDGGLQRIVEQALPSLSSLEIDEDGVTVVGATSLASSRWSAQVRQLSLSDNAVGIEGLAALIAGRGKLESLRLGGDSLGNAGATAIANTQRFSSMRELALPRNRISQSGLQALLDSPHLRGLTSLDLSGNPLGAGGRERLRERFP
jgi:uncharacterized protein (TIGR02996 family)